MAYGEEAAAVTATTSPLFILPIALFSHNRIGLRAILGAILAVVGIVVLFMV